MNCPQCNRAMRQTDYEGVLIHICDKCGGEFMGSTELAHIVNTREEQFSEEARAVLADVKPEFGIPASETERELACPQCDTKMKVLNYCGDSGVFIDRCPSCGGIWLDHCELDSLQILMERWADEAPEQLRSVAGELEAVRQREAERTSHAFKGSRFAFINAIVNRFLDAA